MKAKVDWYKPKFNRLMGILIPTTRQYLEEWRGEGWSNKWIAREGNERVLDEIRRLSFIEKMKLAFDILRF